MDKRSLRKIDMVGKTFGALEVLEEAGKNKYGKILYKCRCLCGKESLCVGQQLRKGSKKSCGCMQGVRGEYKEKEYIRSHSNRIFDIWQGMLYRCSKGGTSNREIYFERGIRVCEEWEKDFYAFAKWAVENGYDDMKEIDRIDNDKGYSPNNCQWVLHIKNAQNRRTRNPFGASGVTWRKSKTGQGGRWRVSIGVENRKINLGSFQDLEEAVKVRKEAELKYWGFQKIERG